LHRQQTLTRSSASAPSKPVEDSVAFTLPVVTPGNAMSWDDGSPVVTSRNGRARIGLPFELAPNPDPSVSSMKKSNSTPTWRQSSNQ
jgi:hypothetical protein